MACMLYLVCGRRVIFQTEHSSKMHSLASLARKGKMPANSTWQGTSQVLGSLVCLTAGSHRSPSSTNPNTFLRSHIIHEAPPHPPTPSPGGDQHKHCLPVRWRQSRTQHKHMSARKSYHLTCTHPADEAGAPL